jgi:hypothetical protein
MTDPYESVVDYDREELRTMRALDPPMEIDEPTRSEILEMEAEERER